ncbi:MAG: aminotransferase class V-fold PLP-dependent enzyme [Negativicutes bacterium]|nr:aminotransferase class V-fold PLP-dependent enzyme [Negativicutes bacterium]
MPVYLDNAATSWPKHPDVFAAMARFMQEDAGNPGRSGHSMSVAAARTVFAAREAVASIVGAQSPERVVFTKNATEALNVILFGLLTNGGHVITSSVEHNAVMRPLRYLERQGVRLSVVVCDGRGLLDPDDIRRAVSPETKLIILTHASNVCGAIQPIAAVGRIAREYGVPFAVDAAQTAGSEPINIAQDYIDFLAFTGHKGLGGPQGTGGLVLAEDRDLPPLLHGGTGSLSDSEYQPEFLPDKLESGTLNAVGLAGLAAAVKVTAARFDVLRQRKKELLATFFDGLAAVPGVKTYGPINPEQNAGVVSITIRDRVSSEVGLALDRVFGILTRTGLHCAPAAHKTLGTFPQGTVRLSLGASTTSQEITTALEAISRIADMAG